MITFDAQNADCSNKKKKSESTEGDKYLSLRKQDKGRIIQNRHMEAFINYIFTTNQLYTLEKKEKKKHE